MGKAAEAAVALEQAFLRAAPSSRSARMSEAAWTQSLKQFHHDARAIRQHYALGFFRRAQAAYYLQQRLMEAGIRADTVRKVVFSLVLNSFSGE